MMMTLPRKISSRIFSVIHELTLTNKLVLLISLLIAAISLFIFIYAPTKFEEQAFDSMSNNAKSIASIVSSSIGPALIFDDTTTIEETIESLKQISQISYLVFEKKNRQIFASYRLDIAEKSNYRIAQSKNQISEDGLHFLVYAEVKAQNIQVGGFYLGISLYHLKEEVANTRASIAIASLLIFIIGVISVIGISTIVTRPLANMVTTTESIIAGDLSKRASVVYKDEVGQLATSFNLMVDRLHKTNTELEAFTYSVSHDLRAPLRAINGYTNILIEDYEKFLDEEGKRVCAVICNETKRMGQLIDDLLSFSRFSRAEMQISPINMEALVNSVFHELTTTESRERIEFSVAHIPSIAGDSTLIRQVWMNLISNAIKFSSKREKAIIEVGHQEDREEIIFLVRDNGAGFDMKYKNKLFGVFQRLHAEREFEGTGVGLAIVQRLIHRHGGKVWAEGQLDKGATFYFTIPLKGEKSWIVRTK